MMPFFLNFLAALFKKTRLRAWDLFFFVLYALVTGFMLLHHERWYDEAGPWLIARDADLGSFIRILFQNYDRHPGLFYILLLPFAKMGFPYATIAILNWFIVLSAAYLFLRNAPFPGLFKYLFIFSFYLSYEYAIIARPYGLAVLIIFFIASLYPQRFIKPKLYATSLALLFHTEYLCFGLAAALGMLFVYESWQTKIKSRQIISAFLIMAAAGLLAFLTGHSLQPDHAEYGRTLPFQIQNILPAIFKSLIPFDLIFGKFIFPKEILWVFIALILLAGFLFFCRRPQLIFVLFLAYAEFFYIYTHIQAGDLRHFGFILITLVFTLWIEKTYPKDHAGWNALQKKVFSFLMIAIGLCLALGIRSAYFAYQLDYYLPFSGSKMMANQIRAVWKEHPFLKNRVIVAKDSATASILPYLPEKKFWNPCLKSIPQVHHALKVLIGCNALSHQEMVQTAEQNFGGLDSVLFLVKTPFPFQESPDYRFHLLASANQYVFGYGAETFHLYLPEKKQRA